MEAINKFLENVKDFIVTNGENPIFWLVIFFLGIAIFWLTYDSLHKNK